ncbi:MAG TPA: ectonucleotide pyrophosphatase/phosphodiesterase [Edaphobacter sp.]|nr:ectonucleotide pyrophosphatase/phosphodiesterase [Edaphobacter sp.]
MSHCRHKPTNLNTLSFALLRRVGYSRKARTALRSLTIIQLLAALALLIIPANLSAQSKRQVILISIDGMTPDEYIHPDEHHLAIPNLRAMAAAGCASPGMLGVFPSSTYPSHTSMVTGVPPAIHGIVSNTPIDPFNLESGGWYYYAEQIKVPTLYQIVRNSGIKTAAVSWPVTVGADINYLIPEYRPIRTPEDLALVHALSTKGLMQEFEQTSKTTEPPLSDAWRTEAAMYILRTRKPGLLLLHLSGLDEEQHKYGPHTPETHAELERLDAMIGKLRQQVEQSGNAANTSWLIVSDHGFLPYSKQFNPLVALRNAGLIDADDNGKVRSWKVYARNSTGSFVLEAKDKSDTASIAKATALMQQLAADPANGIARLYTVEDLHDLGASPDAFLGAEAARGFGFGASLTGPLLNTPTNKGTHGYNPSIREMHPSFILYGAGITPCKSLPDVKIFDVGPTAAALLGVSMTGTQGTVVDYIQTSSPK